jgi:hypothetical protein
MVVRLKDYYINAICDSKIGTDVASPVGSAHYNTPVTNLFWVGLRAWNNAAKDPLSTTFTLDWQKDGGSWNTLAATGELKWAGVGNMVVTDYTPATGIFFCTSCGGNAVDGAMHDAAAAVTLDIATDDDSEWWWAIDPAGASAFSSYAFRVNDNRGQFTNTVLACTVGITGTLTVNEAYHEHEGGIWNDKIPLIVPLIVAECGHACEPDADIIIVEVEGAIDLEIAPDPYHTFHPTADEIAGFDLTIGVDEAYHILTDDIWLWIADAAHVLTNDAITGFDLTIGVDEAYHVMADDDWLWIDDSAHVLTNDAIDPFSVRGSSHVLTDDAPLTLVQSGAIDLVVQEAHHDHEGGIWGTTIPLIVPLTMQEAAHILTDDDWMWIADARAHK